MAPLPSGFSITNGPNVWPSCMARAPGGRRMFLAHRRGRDRRLATVFHAGRRLSASSAVGRVGRHDVDRRTSTHEFLRGGTNMFRQTTRGLGLALLLACLLIGGCAKKVTKANFDKIATGMTLKEVEAVLGKGE